MHKLLCTVKSRFIWIYASVQFALVVLFAHIFYSLVMDFCVNYSSCYLYFSLETKINSNNNNTILEINGFLCEL